MKLLLYWINEVGMYLGIKKGHEAPNIFVIYKKYSKNFNHVLFDAITMLIN